MFEENCIGRRQKICHLQERNKRKPLHEGVLRCELAFEIFGVKHGIVELAWFAYNFLSVKGIDVEWEVFVDNFLPRRSRLLHLCLGRVCSYQDDADQQ